MMERHVFSEAIQECLGDLQVAHLLFCTHDLDPQFFEQEVLPVFIGNDLKHNRRTREVQLDYTIRERQIEIDVYYEPRALITYEGTARLGWYRHKMSGLHGGIFHPKVILALCVDDEGTESLLVCISSANLTRSSWWNNVECADLQLLTDGVRHSYVDGLKTLLDRLQQRRRSHGQSPNPATKAIKRFLSRQSGFVQKTTGGTLRPQLLAGHDDLVDSIDQLFGSRLHGTHLEIVSPFFNGDERGVLSTLQAFTDTFAPQTVLVALPARAHRTTISKEVYDAVPKVPGATWASLPRDVTAAARGDSAVARAVHAKVYRFWRGGSQPIEVFVVGSHNLTSSALTGKQNWETSVVIETTNARPARFLQDDPDAPQEFSCLDEDLETLDDSLRIPLSVAFDWNTRVATARWESADAERVSLHRSGALICSISLPGGTTRQLNAEASAAIAQVLLRSCLVTVRRTDGGEGPLLIEELNHDSKPDLLEGLELTPAEIFALWSITDLQDRVRRLARARATVGPDEDNFELVGLEREQQPSMFDRFAGVFHAFSSLRRRVDAAIEANRPRRAGLAVYAEQFDSPFHVLRLVRDQAEQDLPLAYVTYSSARLLDRYVRRSYPELATEFKVQRAQLLNELTFESEIRRRLVETASDDAMEAFLDWFDKHFATETVESA